MNGKPKTRKLTAKQEKFAREYASGCSGAEAYRRAYNAKNTPPNQCTLRASELLANSSIAVLAASLKKAADTAAVQHLMLTREFVIEGLMKTARMAMGEEPTPKTANLAAANAALTSLGKIDTLGLFVDKSKVELSRTFDDMTDAELDAYIAERT
jgi:hypothetical protein